ncbi:MAG: tetratricopeptide repeat protein [Candidatus Eisenbacteria bacterium]
MSIDYNDEDALPREGEILRDSGRKMGILAVVALAVAAGIVASVQIVPGGKIGVVETGGALEYLEPGPHLRLPWKRAAVYPVEPVSTDIKVESQTPGGTLAAGLVLEISVERDRVGPLHRSYQGRYEEDLVAPLVSDYLRRHLSVFDSYSKEDDNQRIEQGMLETLTPSLATYGVNLHSVSLKSLDLVIDEQDAAIIEVAERLGGKVVIIGSDALDWEIYKQVSEHTPMPNIERLIQEGATGDLVSMDPLVSPMIWTTMATGVEPHVHGIIDFLQKDEATGEDVPITSSMRRVPALWNIATRFGLSSGFIGWLGTYPAEPVSGFMVSDRIVFHTFDPRWTSAEYDESAHDETEDVAGLAFPESLIYELRPMIVGYEDVSYETLRRYIDVTPEEIAPTAKTFDPLDPIRNLRLILASNITYERAGIYLYQKFRPDLFSVYLDMVDNVCHLFIKHMEPHTSDISDEDAAKYGHAVAAAYLHTDSLIGEWLDTIDDETTLVLLSDHGFKSGDIRPAGPSAIGGGQPIKWHRLAGAIALYGNRIKRGVRFTDASVLDVAPTLLRLLGLPASTDMPGRILEEALDEGWVASTSGIGEIDSYGTMAATGSVIRREDEQEAILERLRALGYIGGSGSGSTGLMRLASSHFANAEFDKAIEIWREVLSQDPDNATVMTSIADALVHKGEPEEAVSVLKEAIEKDPNFLDAQNMLAISYINLGRLSDATRVSREIIAKDPRNAEAYFNLGVVSHQQGSHDQALSAFKRSVELRPDYDESRINLAGEYIRRGAFNPAKTQLETALEINPLSLQGWHSLGKVYQGLRDNDKAIECYREALKIHPGFNPARTSLAVILASGGQFEDAKRELEEGLGYEHEVHMVHINLGILNRQLGDFKASEKHFKEAIRIDAHYLPARFDLVNLYLANGDEEKGRKELEAILKIDPANDQARALIETLR